MARCGRNVPVLLLSVSVGIGIAGCAPFTEYVRGGAWQSEPARQDEIGAERQRQEQATAARAKETNAQLNEMYKAMGFNSQEEYMEWARRANAARVAGKSTGALGSIPNVLFTGVTTRADDPAGFMPSMTAGQSRAFEQLLQAGRLEAAGDRQGALASYRAALSADRPENGSAGLLNFLAAEALARLYASETVAPGELGELRQFLVDFGDGRDLGRQAAEKQFDSFKRMPFIMTGQLPGISRSSDGVDGRSGLEAARQEAERALEADKEQLIESDRSALHYRIRNVKAVLTFLLGDVEGARRQLAEMLAELNREIGAIDALPKWKSANLVGGDPAVTADEMRKRFLSYWRYAQRSGLSTTRVEVLNNLASIQWRLGTLAEARDTFITLIAESTTGGRTNETAENLYQGERRVGGHSQRILSERQFLSWYRAIQPEVDAAISLDIALVKSGVKGLGPGYEVAMARKARTTTELSRHGFAQAAMVDYKRQYHDKREPGISNALASLTRKVFGISPSGLHEERESEIATLRRKLQEARAALAMARLDGDPSTSDSTMESQLASLQQDYDTAVERAVYEFDSMYADSQRRERDALAREGGFDGEAYRRAQQVSQSQRQRLSEAFAIPVPSVAAIRSAIPAASAVIDIYRIREFQPRGDTSMARWGADRYVAYVLQSERDVQVVDLGPAQRIDELISRFRQDVAQANSPAEQTYRELNAALWQPLASRIGSAQKLLIVPDGNLTRFPFAAIKESDGRFLIERMEISYLQNVRELLDRPAPRQDDGDIVVVAAPQFSASSNVNESTRRRSVALVRGGFEDLPGTQAEADALKRLAPKAKVLTGAAASESSVVQLNSPRILHLATHGFFLADKQAQKEFFADENTPLLDAMLRSGLAFTGANLAGAKGLDDGVLTAFEVLGLNLYGTRMVVLSACETGLGDVETNQGGYGLRRAFSVSGAESVVMSLWAVEDNATKDLMVAMYQALKAGKARGTALREAQLALIQRGRSPKKPGEVDLSQPLFWAAFMLSGQSGPLPEGL